MKRKRNVLKSWPLALGLAAVVATTAVPKANAGIDPYLGEVMTVAFNFCPKGFLPLDGSLLPISQNQALFALLGTTYGGNGTTTFALPRTKPVLTLVQGAPLLQCIAIQGVFPSQN